MNRKRQTFVKEVLKHGDKARAYGKAYPNSKESTHGTSAARLMHDPEINEAINGTLQQMRAELEAEIRAEMKVEIAAEMDYKIMLSQIIRREIKIERQVKNGPEQMTLYSDPGFAQMIKAGLVLGAMEGWNMGAKSKEQRRAEKQSERAEEEKKKQSGERRAFVPESLKDRLQRMAMKKETASDIWIGSKDDPEYLALSPEEQDTLRRRGRFHECSYKCVSEYYTTNARNFKTDEQLRDRDYFLQKALHYDRSHGVTEGHPETGAEGSGSWQPKGENQGRHFDQREKSPENMQLATSETSGDFSLRKAFVRNDGLDFDGFEKVSDLKQNETKSSTSPSKTNSSDNNKNINKSKEIVKPKQYFSEDALKAAGYMRLEEKLKKHEWYAKNNRALREKAPGLPICDDERSYMKYELMKNALALPEEVCNKVFSSLGYELYAYDNNWFRWKR